MRILNHGLQIFIILIFSLLKLFLIDHFYVKGDNMFPTLQKNDYILYKKYSYGWSIWNGTFLRRYQYMKNKAHVRMPNHGDLVIFFYDDNINKTEVKRVIAIEGETIQIINGTLFVDLEPINKSFMETITIKSKDGGPIDGSIYLVKLNNGLEYNIFESEYFKKSPIYNTEQYIVPKNHVWIQDDFYPDSHSVLDITNGIVSINNLIGKPFCIIAGSKSESISKKKSDSIILNTLKYPYKLLNYFWNLDITRVWRSVH